MKYDQTLKPIEARPSSLWLIKLPDGRTILDAWHAEATIEEVHRAYSQEHKQFTLSPIWLGKFLVSETIALYSPDSRRDDQDWDIS